MSTELTPKQRTLIAVEGAEPDRVPIRFMGLAPFDHLWRDQCERAEARKSVV